MICQCGEEVAPDNTFCPSCARELRPAPVTQPHDAWQQENESGTNTPPASRTDLGTWSTTPVAFEGMAGETPAASPAVASIHVSEAYRGATGAGQRVVAPRPAPATVRPVANPAQQTTFAPAPGSEVGGLGSSTWSSGSSVPPRNPYAAQGPIAPSDGTVINGRPANATDGGGLFKTAGGLVIAAFVLLGKFGGALASLGIFKIFLYLWLFGHGFGGILLILILLSVVGGLVLRSRGGLGT